MKQPADLAARKGWKGLGRRWWLPGLGGTLLILLLLPAVIAKTGIRDWI